MHTFTTFRLADIRPLSEIPVPVMDSDDAHADRILGLRADNDLLRLALDRSEAERGKLRNLLARVLAGYEEIMDSHLPALIKASFSAYCDGDKIRAALAKTKEGA